MTPTDLGLDQMVDDVVTSLREYNAHLKSVMITVAARLVRAETACEKGHRKGIEHYHFEPLRQMAMTLSGAATKKFDGRLSPRMRISKAALTKALTQHYIERNMGMPGPIQRDLAHDIWMRLLRDPE